MDGRTFSKAAYNKNLKVILDGSSPVKLSIKANESEKQYDFLCRDSFERDALTITIRLFNQIQMMGKARPPDTNVALLEWIRNTNTTDEVGVVDSKALREIKLIKEKDASWTTSNGRSRGNAQYSGSSQSLKPASSTDRGRSLSHSATNNIQKSPSSTRTLDSNDEKEASGRHGKSLSVSDSNNILPLDIFADMIVPTDNKILTTTTTTTTTTTGGGNSNSSTPGKVTVGTPLKNRPNPNPTTSPIPEEKDDENGQESSKNSNHQQDETPTKPEKNKGKK